MGLTEAQPTEQKLTRPEVDVPLIKAVKKEYPEARGMTYAGVIDWGLRKLLGKKKGA